MKNTTDPHQIEVGALLQIEMLGLIEHGHQNIGYRLYGVPLQSIGMVCMHCGTPWVSRAVVLKVGATLTSQIPCVIIVNKLHMILRRVDYTVSSTSRIKKLAGYSIDSH
jgi:hypothetical protein